MARPTADSDLSYETILYDVADGVATITLNQPDTRNALSNELLGELIDAFESARDDDAVRCVVLASSHDRVFSSGANLGGFAGDFAAATPAGTALSATTTASSSARLMVRVMSTPFGPSVLFLEPTG